MYFCAVDMIKYILCKHVVLFLMYTSERIGLSSAIQVCHHGQESTHLTNLNMTSSPISDSYGMCSCRIDLIDDARLTMFPEMTVPGCSTGVSLSDLPYEFTCTNGKIDYPMAYVSGRKAGDVLWLFVTSTSVSQVMTGNLQIKTTPSSSQFTLECFDANTNTSETTQVPKTTTKTSTTPSPTTTITTIISSTTARSTISIIATTAVNNVTTSTTNSLTTPTTLSHKSTGQLEAECTTRSQDATAAIAGGIAGCVTVLVIIVTGSVIFHRRYRCIRRTAGDQIPESRDHPTYCDLTNRENSEYEHIDNTEGPKRIYQNVALDMNE